MERCNVWHERVGLKARCSKEIGHDGQCDAHEQVWVKEIRAAAKRLGFVVVPVEPTEAMIRAFDTGSMGASSKIHTSDFADGYRSMIAAATEAAK